MTQQQVVGDSYVQLIISIARGIGGRRAGTQNKGRNLYIARKNVREAFYLQRLFVRKQKLEKRIFVDQLLSKLERNTIFVIIMYTTQYVSLADVMQLLSIESAWATIKETFK